jgi:hypothetical protein
MARSVQRGLYSAKGVADLRWDQERQDRVDAIANSTQLYKTNEWHDCDTELQVDRYVGLYTQ